MGDRAHRPVPHQAVRWFQLFSIARRSGPSITTYTSMVKVQVLNCTIYEMASRYLGGGKPELAYVKFSPQHAELVSDLGLPIITNVAGLKGFCGPVLVLLNTDKNLFLVNKEEVNEPEIQPTKPSSLVTINQLSSATNSIGAIVGTNNNKTVRTNMLVAPLSLTIVTERLTAKQIRADLIDVVIYGR